jgi:hypothetical protein
LAELRSCHRLISMKPDCRIPKTIKWGGGAVTGLILVMWIGSGWWTYYWHRRGGCLLTVSSGRLDFHSAGCAAPYPEYGARFLRTGGRFNLGLPAWGHIGNGWFAQVPLWPLPAGTTLITALGWSMDARARRRQLASRLNLCPKCNYDRAGLAVGAKCPECSAIPLGRRST